MVRETACNSIGYHDSLKYLNIISYKSLTFYICKLPKADKKKSKSFWFSKLDTAEPNGRGGFFFMFFYFLLAEAKFPYSYLENSRCLTLMSEYRRENVQGFWH